jgi:hypothetical protein
MSNMTPFEIRLELLKMARDMLTEEYHGKREIVNQEWHTKVEEANRLPELRRICGACTERKECLEYAIREEIPYGFFGGKTPLERGQDKQRSQRSIRAERIVKLRSKGVSAEDIARLMHLKVTYVYRIFTEANQARKREDQSNPKRSTQSDDSSSPLGSAQ